MSGRGDGCFELIEIEATNLLLLPRTIWKGKVRCLVYVDVSLADVKLFCLQGAACAAAPGIADWSVRQNIGHCTGPQYSDRIIEYDFKSRS